jgi:hypothetical protein
MKYLAIFCIVFFFGISCNYETEKTTTTTKIDSTNIIVANKLFEKFNAHDWAGMSALYTDTAEFKDPSLGTTIVKQTRQQTIAKYTQLSEVMKDIKDSVIAIYSAGNKTAIIEFISKGTAPDGSKFELPICSILTLNNNGLIEKDFTYYDNSGTK